MTCRTYGPSAIGAITRFANAYGCSCDPRRLPASSSTSQSASARSTASTRAFLLDGNVGLLSPSADDPLTGVGSGGAGISSSARPKRLSCASPIT